MILTMLGTRKNYLHHLSDLNHILWGVPQVSIYHNDDFSSGYQLFRHVTEIAFIPVIGRTRNPGDMMCRNTCRLDTDYCMAYYVYLDVGQFYRGPGKLNLTLYKHAFQNGKYFIERITTVISQIIDTYWYNAWNYRCNKCISRGSVIKIFSH